MAAAKKKAASKGAASGPTVEDVADAKAAVAAVVAPAEVPPAPETKTRKKKWDIVENKLEYVILLNGKNSLRGLCASKDGVTRMLESMSAKERERAHVFQRVPVELKTKVDIVWK